ncbi:disorganized muscle protein 1-like [Uloborus diversus]|uniref:disorganized muscle protein 1-like n=1 Tax=Uloborus diversus TaxID=327109 RepID=UPI00240A6017|nr:disorganized muscle protein 1-like [Uloborus diversus]
MQQMKLNPAISRNKPGWRIKHEEERFPPLYLKIAPYPGGSDLDLQRSIFRNPHNEEPRKTWGFGRQNFFSSSSRDQKAPVFKKKPAIRQEEDGERLLFECVIEANPVPTISWFRDEKPVTETDRIKLKCDRKGNESHCALVIDDVDEDDGGKYKVTAKNKLGESSATINLNFDTEEEEEEVGKPVFVGKPLIKQSPDFNSIIFECQLTADPKPTLQWFHNGKAINDGGRYKSLIKPSAAGFVVTLEVAQVMPVKRGKAPRFPKKPAIKQEGDSLCLEVVLEAHPFPKILWFLGNKEVKEGPRHKIKKKEVSKDTYLLSLEILDPEPENDGGTYRCNAVNELGESNANIALNLQAMIGMRDALKYDCMVIDT